MSEKVATLKLSIPTAQAQAAVRGLAKDYVQAAREMQRAGERVTSLRALQQNAVDAGTRLDGLRAKARELGQEMAGLTRAGDLARSVGELAKMRDGLARAASEAQRTRQRLQDLRQLDNGGPAARAGVRTAARNAQGAEAVWWKQAQDVGALERSLSGAGVDITDLAGEQRRLIGDAQRLGLLTAEYAQLSREIRSTGTEAKSATDKAASLSAMLRKAGVDTASLTAEQKRLEGALKAASAAAASEQARVRPRQRQAHAENVLGVRSDRSLQMEIAALEAALKRLRDSGRATSAELARAQASVNARVAKLREQLGAGDSVMQARLRLRIEGDGAVKARLGEIRQALSTLKSSGELTAVSIAKAALLARREIASVRAEMGSLSGQGNGLAGIVGGIGVTYAAVGLFREITSGTDQYAEMRGQINLVTESADQLDQTMRRLYETAQDTRSEFGATVGLFASVSRSTEQLNKSTSERLKLTTAINQATKISAQGEQASSAAIMQLGQALQSGVLQGDELRSIREQAPRLFEAIIEGAQKVAPSLRITRQNFKELASEGKISSELVVEALLSQSDTIDAEFRKLPRTVGQAMTQVRNAVINAVGTSDTSPLIQFLDELRAKLEDPAIQQQLVNVANAVITIASAVGKLLTTIASGNIEKLLEVLAALKGFSVGSGIGASIGAVLGGVPGAGLGYVAGGLIGAGVAGGAVDNALKGPEAARRLTTDELRARLLQDANTFGNAANIMWERISSGRSLIEGSLEGDAKQLEAFNAKLKSTVDQLADLNGGRPVDAAKPGFVQPKQVDPDSIRADSQSTIAILKAQNDATEADLERRMKDGVITLQQYTAERNKLIASSFDAEIAARSRESAALGDAISQLRGQNTDQATKKAGELGNRKTGVDAELTVLRTERKAALDASAADARQKERELAEYRAQLNIDLLKAQGRDNEAALAELNQQYQQWLQKAGRDAESMNLADRLFDSSEAQIELQKLLTALQRAQDKYEGERDDITAGRVTGAIGSETEGRGKLRAAKDEYQKTLAEIRAEWEKTRASGTFSAQQIEGFDRALSTAAGKLKAYDSPLRSMLRDWGSQFDNLERASVGWANSALDALTQLVTTGKADFRGFATAILQEMVRIQLAAVAASAMSGMSGVMGSAIGSGLAAAFGGGVSSTGTYTSYNGAAGGGYINSKGDVIGPGSDTSDSVDSVVPAGSYVLRAAAVRAYGRAELERLLASGKHHAVKLSRGEKVVEPGRVNKLGLRLLDSINNADRYADGGLVGRAAARVQKDVARSRDINVNVPVTVQGGNSMDEERADRMGRRIDAATRQIVREELTLARGPRGTLSRYSDER